MYLGVERLPAGRGGGNGRGLAGKGGPSLLSQFSEELCGVNELRLGLMDRMLAGCRPCAGLMADPLDLRKLSRTESLSKANMGISILQQC